MKKYTIAWFGLIANVMIVLMLMLQATKTYFLWRKASADLGTRKKDVINTKSLRNRLILAGMYSSIVLNPLLVLIGLLGYIQTPIVIVCFIFVNVLLILDFCTSVGYMRLRNSSDFAESLELFRQPVMYSFIGYGIYFLIRIFIIVLLSL